MKKGNHGNALTCIITQVMLLSDSVINLYILSISHALSDITFYILTDIAA